jgi:hypothetical protein
MVQKAVNLLRIVDASLVGVAIGRLQLVRAAADSLSYQPTRAPRVPPHSCFLRDSASNVHIPITSHQVMTNRLPSPYSLPAWSWLSLRELKQRPS